MSTDVKINAETARLLATFQVDPAIEIRAMEKVSVAIRPLDLNARRRVLEWAKERFTPLFGDNGLSYATVWATLLGDMAQAVDAHRDSIEKAGREWTSDERHLFSLLDQWRGKPKQPEAVQGGHP